MRMQVLSGAQPQAQPQLAGEATLPRSLIACTHWREVDFISDLHLHAGDPQTFSAWDHYLRNTTAQAVFMLGDLFEVWVGDDVLLEPHDAALADSNFEAQCAQTLQDASQRLDLHFLCGNRDFLVGAQCLHASAMHGLDDPCVLQMGSARWLLSHGDALCLNDIAYQQFRTLVRSTAWQRDFLAQPLAQRQATARQLRAQSEQHKRAHPVPAQVDAELARQWLRDAGASVLIHGHTHQPAEHALGDDLVRIVLSDWDLQAAPARAQVLRLKLDAAGTPLMWRRLSPADSC